MEAYPLQWPFGKPRSIYTVSSRFDDKRNIGDATNKLLHEIKLLGGSQVVVSANVRLRNDGLPYAIQAQPVDKGVAIYFKYSDRQMCFACDRWDRIQDNIYAVAMTIEALRGIERWGSGSMVEQAFMGFMALPAPDAPIDAHAILGVAPGASAAEIERAWREATKISHPDHGGSDEKQARVNAARAQLKREL